MYKRLSAVLFPIVTILLIGSLVFGYHEQQEKNAVLIKAENQYQRAFGNLTYYIKQLNDQLGHSLAVNSTSNDYQRKGLIKVWRMTSEAQQQIGQLPMNFIPFTDAETFLTKVSNFAYKAAVRDLMKEPLTKEELSTLQTLRQNAQDISTQLIDLQDRISGSGLRWIDVEVALGTDETSQQNPVVSTLNHINGDIVQYPEVNWGPAVNSMYTDDNVMLLSGENVNEQDVKQLAERFIGKEASNMEIVANGTDSKFATYTAKVDNQKLTFTKKGGHLIGYLNERDIEESRLDKKQATEKALAFLKEHGYQQLELVNYLENEYTAAMSFVCNQDGVLIYPDKVNIRIALDNGEVVGMQASEYASHHRFRTFSNAIISEAEARKAIHPNLKIKTINKAVIKGEQGEEVLCYEFVGDMDDRSYRIYINGETGLEETIERIYE